MDKNRATKGGKKEVPVVLPGCFARPSGSGCPIDWCRRARGDWCKNWRTGEICQWKKI